MRTLFALLLAVFVISKISFAEVPSTMNYQGKLENTLGGPVSDGNYSITFAIYDQASVGTSLWSETRTVSVSDGLFTVDLGALNPLNETIFSSTPRYLGIKVGADAEQSPRNLLSTVPYAFQAASAASSSPTPVPHTDWVCPFFHAWNDMTGTPIDITFIYFLNTSAIGTTITLTFYDFVGTQIDQCSLVIGGHSRGHWRSDSATDCPAANTNGSSIEGWFTLSSTQPIAPWGYFINIDGYNFGGGDMAVPLTFYAQ